MKRIWRLAIEILEIQIYSFTSQTSNYLNSRPQLRHLFGSLTNKKRSESKQVNGAPITATKTAHSGTVPLTTLVEWHLTQTFAGTAGRAIGCGVW